MSAVNFTMSVGELLKKRMLEGAKLCTLDGKLYLDFNTIVIKANGAVTMRLLFKQGDIIVAQMDKAVQLVGGDIFTIQGVDGKMGASTTPHVVTDL